MRLKAKAADKRELPYKNRDGSDGKAVRVTIAAVWENDNGALAVKFEQPQHDALCKSFGLPAGSKLYFDLFETDAAPKAKADDDGMDF